MALLVWAAVAWAAMAAFVVSYEEPTLADRYGAQYEEYRRAVPAWLPRLSGDDAAAHDLRVEALADAVGDRSR